MTSFAPDTEERCIITAVTQRRELGYFDVKVSEEPRQQTADFSSWDPPPIYPGGGSQSSLWVDAGHALA